MNFRFSCVFLLSIMVFVDLNTTENKMSSITAGVGGTFTNSNSSLPQTTKSNPQTNPSTTNSITSSSNEIPLPTYNINDPRAILKTLIRFIMRTFYDIPKSLVIEYIYHYERIKQQDLADRLCLDPKQVRSYIQEFKRDKFIIEDHRLESNDGTTGRRNQDQYYYKIDTSTFINVVKYRLINMQTYVENLERQQTYKQSNYKCEQCSKEYTELDIGKLYDLTQDTLICLICGGYVHEDIETKETTATTNRQVATMSLFNEQMKPLYQILEKIDDIMTNEQQLKNSSDQDFFQQNGNSSLSSSNHHLSKDAIASSTAHRSHASNVFDRTSTINHDIQIIIEKDDDDHYSQMDIDETSNTDTIVPISSSSSSRGPGKPGKKPTKLVQSAAEVASQPVTTKMKYANKKVPYEHKPLPHWFVRSTVHSDQDEEHRLNNLSLHSATNSSTISRQLSNQKLTKSTTLNDIKQMLLIHESRRKKTLSLTTIEDSLSPPTPTPIQITKTTDSQ
jgi:transcription initiation factor IIE alpha subunit